MSDELHPYQVRFLFLFPGGAKIPRFALHPPDCFSPVWVVYDRTRHGSLASALSPEEAVDQAIRRHHQLASRGE